MLPLKRGHLMVTDLPGWRLPPQASRDHVEAFSCLVRYAVKLRREGYLDDNEFQTIVTQATANFVESEISQRVDTIINNKFFQEKLLEVF